ncbi:MAG: hypothetical protein JKY34_07290 [Kordiimonadaceae bacterium]|nr:hypothetical protein [Kordiimonadaceae bacterium]
MISVPAEILTALGSDAFHHEWLLELPDGVSLTTHNADITINGNTYLATGHIMKIPPIQREKEIKLHSVSIQLSGVDGWIEASLTTRNMTNEPCALHLVLIDDAGSVVGGQSLNMYKGKFDTWSLRETSKQDIITVKLSSAWAKSNKTSGRMTNPQDQQELHDGDRFFEFAHEEKDHIGWGGEA